MNPLESNPTARRRTYQVFWIVGLILGATQVGYAAADAGQPTWLTVTLAVFAFLGAGVGYTAARNVPAADIAPSAAALVSLVRAEAPHEQLADAANILGAKIKA